MYYHGFIGIVLARGTESISVYGDFENGMRLFPTLLEITNTKLVVPLTEEQFKEKVIPIFAFSQYWTLNAKHPEMRPSELLLTNHTKGHLYEIGYKTKRAGTQALDLFGKPFSGPVPVVVSRKEYLDKYADCGNMTDL